MLKFIINAVCIVGILAMLLYMLIALTGLAEAQAITSTLRSVMDNRPSQ